MRRSRHLPHVIGGQCSSRSSCASAQTDPRATLSNETPFYTEADGEALNSDCADAQADLKLDCPHMAIFPGGERVNLKAFQHFSDLDRTSIRIPI